MSESVYYLKKYANEIVPGVWVGNKSACGYANMLGMKSICVLEWECYTPGCIHKPILPELQDGWVGISSVLVDPDLLNEAIDAIEYYKSLGPILVHCGAGMERSPLATAAWMVRHYGCTLDESYNLLKEKRPIVEDRRSWLGLNKAADSARAFLASND